MIKNKSAILNKLSEVADLLQKCGGEGGTPGPCPTGGSGGTKPGKVIKPPQESVQREAQARTAKARDLTAKAGEAGNPVARGKSAKEHAADAIQHTQNAMSAKTPQEAIQHHKLAASSHYAASVAHQNARPFLGLNKPEPAHYAGHQAASEAHNNAARAHESAAKGSKKVNDNMAEYESNARPGTGGRGPGTGPQYPRN